MLPDYPQLKAKLRGLLTHVMNAQIASYKAPLKEARGGMLFEGSRVILVGPDGAAQKLKKLHVEAKTTIDLTRAGDRTAGDVLKELDSAAKKLAIQESRITYQELRRAAERSGNLIAFEDREFVIDDFFDMLERVNIDFDENGKPQLMIIVGGRDPQSVIDTFAKSEPNPDHKKRFEEIMERKKEQWRDREASRELVG